MIKRILVALALIVLPSLAMADATDRDFLLTPNGTLYTVESVFTDQLTNVDTHSTRVLTFTVRNDEGTTTTIIPETLLGGSHTAPALAYDPASEALFVFWQRGINNGMSSDLVFCSYQKGKWSEATSVDSANYHYSHNIQIGVTRKVDQIDEKGNHTSVAGLTVHAVWWEESGHKEWARYAMLTIDNGSLTDIQIADLSLFTDVSRDLARPNDPDFNNEILRHPTLSESNTHDTVDIVFGDLISNNMHRVTIKPVVDFRTAGNGGRLRVPIGVKDTGIGAPHFRTEATARVEALSGDGNKVVLYTSGKDGVKYVSFSNGSWSPSRTLSVDDKVTADAAVDVLRRMVNTD
jgi:hypothetical protein